MVTKAKRTAGNHRKAMHGARVDLLTSHVLTRSKPSPSSGFLPASFAERATAQPVHTPTLRDDIVEAVRRVESGEIKPILVSGKTAEDRLNDILASLPNHHE